MTLRGAELGSAMSLHDQGTGMGHGTFGKLSPNDLSFDRVFSALYSFWPRVTLWSGWREGHFLMVKKKLSFQLGMYRVTGGDESLPISCNLCASSIFSSLDF